MTILSKLRKDDKGAVLAEFALGLIPIILAFALVFEFGRALWSHQAVVKGVRDATRYLSRVSDPTDPVAQGVAQNLLLTAQTAGGGQVRWDSGSNPPMQVQVTTQSAASLGLRGPANIQTVTVAANVEIAIPLSAVFTLVGGGAVTTWNYSVSDTARVYNQ